MTRLNQVMHGWANYFRHAVAKDTFNMLDYLAWWRVIRMLMERHRWRWKDVRRSPQWVRLVTDGYQLIFDLRPY